MAWEDEFLRNLSRIARGHLADPTLFDAHERQWWLDLWRAPVLDAVEDLRIEARWYGPVRAMVVGELPHEPLLNVVLGVGEGGAMEDGHFAAALDWTESLGVDCRIPVTPGRPEAGAAEDLLNQRGYRRSECLVRFVRDGAQPDFPKPSTIEVDELTEETEGCSHYVGEAFALDPVGQCFFEGLPGRYPWRVYAALDENEVGIGSAVMRIDDEVAHFGFAACEPSARRKGAHLALLRRRIRDAGYAGCQALFAETEESLDGLGHPSQAARNLVRAGFKRAMVRPVWRPGQIDD